MSKRKFINTEVEVYLFEWDDNELIEEVESRGYEVKQKLDLSPIEHCWNRGDKKEALILLEREFKWLHGLSNLVK